MATIYEVRVREKDRPFTVRADSFVVGGDGSVRFINADGDKQTIVAYVSPSSLVFFGDREVVSSLS